MPPRVAHAKPPGPIEVKTSLFSTHLALLVNHTLHLISHHPDHLLLGKLNESGRAMASYTLCNRKSLNISPAHLFPTNSEYNVDVIWMKDTFHPAHTAWQFPFLSLLPIKKVKGTPVGAIIAFDSQLGAEL